MAGTLRGFLVYTSNRKNAIPFILGLGIFTVVLIQSEFTSAIKCARLDFKGHTLNLIWLR